MLYFVVLDIIKGTRCFTLKINGMKKYVCNVCGWIYDPDEGCPELDIPEGTPFEKLPEDFVCPLCSVGKEDFSEYEE